MRWFAMGRDEVLAADYTRYIASALIGLRISWHRLYDLEAQKLVQHQLGDIFWLPNVYTPPMSLIAAPVALLPLEHGFLLWSALMLTCVTACCWLLAPRDAPLRAVLLAIFFIPYPVMLGLMHGQVLPLQMAAVAVSFALLQGGRGFAAGALLCVVALKPQGLQLLPFALLVAGRRRAFAGWACAMALLAAAVVAIIGIDGCAAYYRRLQWAGEHPETMWVAWSYTFARRFNPGWTRTLALLGVTAITLFAAWRHRARIEVAYAVGLVGSVLASPYVHLYDFMLLFPAAWLTLRVAPWRWAAPPLLACYGFLLFSEHAQKGPRWVLLGECAWVCALALVPPRWLAREESGITSESAAAATLR